MAKSLYSHQNTLCERRGLLIDHLIINLLTPPPPLPVLLICPSPRTGVCLVSSHILACHLVSPAWHRRGGGLIFSHIHIPLAYCSHCFSTVRPQHFFTSLFFLFFFSAEEAGSQMPSPPPNRRLFQLSYQV